VIHIIYAKEKTLVNKGNIQWSGRGYSPETLRININPNK